MTKAIVKPKPNKVGRPTKYRKEYCEEIIKFFDIEPHFETPVVTKYKDGRETEQIKFIPSDLPLLSAFAGKIGVCRDTINEWANGLDKDGELKHPDFSDSLKRAKDFQRKILITNGLKGLYSTAFAIFTAKNIIGFRDNNSQLNVNIDNRKLYVELPKRNTMEATSRPTDSSSKKKRV